MSKDEKEIQLTKIFIGIIGGILIAGLLVMNLLQLKQITDLLRVIVLIR